MALAYFEKLDNEDGTITARIYVRQVENPPGTIVVKGGFVKEMTGSPEEIDKFLVENIQKKEE
jgi:hypothetical protein